MSLRSCSEMLTPSNRYFSRVRVDTTNTITDWTKTTQSHASLVHDTGLTNGRHAKLRTTLPSSIMSFSSSSFAASRFFRYSQA
jgi:hypothetical protein